MADSTRGNLPKSKSLSNARKLTKHMKEPRRPTKVGTKIKLHSHLFSL